MGSSNLGFFFMGLKVPKVTLGVLGLFLSLSTVAYADIAPSPTVGSATLIAAPNPNPVNYNFTAGTVISSAQVNTNNYKMYADMALLMTKMNATTSLSASYTCPYCITQVLNGAGVVSTISGPTANGQTLSIVLGVVPIGNGGTGTANPSGLIAGSGVTVTGSFPNQTVSSSGIPTYNVVGTGLSSGVKIVQGTANFSANSNVNINFSGAAAFTSATSYACSADANQTNNAFYFNQSSGTASSINTAGNVAITATTGFMCMGT